MQLDGFYYQPSGAETTTGTSKVETTTSTTGGQEGGQAANFLWCRERRMRIARVLTPTSENGKTITGTSKAGIIATLVNGRTGASAATNYQRCRQNEMHLQEFGYQPYRMLRR
jgi:hypothetical protein